MADVERVALRELFRSTGGAYWKIKTNWYTDVELAAWSGVEVNREGRVVKLSLGDNNLSGRYCNVYSSFGSCSCGMVGFGQQVVDG